MTCSIFNSGKANIILCVRNNQLIDGLIQKKRFDFKTTIHYVFDENHQTIIIKNFKTLSFNVGAV